jgi:HTH-type transcriptional regulator, competence development regulator
MTPFGKELRHLRIDLMILAGEMASDLGISSSYLSQIEFGKKPIPDGFVDKICRAYLLSADRASKLQNQAALSMQEYRIRLAEGSSDDDRILANEIALEFARLTPDAKAKISRLIKGGRNV